MTARAERIIVARDYIYEYVMIYEHHDRPNEAIIITHLDLFGHVVPTKLYQDASGKHLHPDLAAHMAETLNTIKSYAIDHINRSTLHPLGEMEAHEYRHQVKLTAPLTIPSDTTIWSEKHASPRVGVLRTPARAQRQKYRKVSFDPVRNVAWITSNIYPASADLANRVPPQWLADWVDLQPGVIPQKPFVVIDDEPEVEVEGEKDSTVQKVKWPAEFDQLWEAADVATQGLQGEIESGGVEAATTVQAMEAERKVDEEEADEDEEEVYEEDRVIW